MQPTQRGHAAVHLARPSRVGMLRALRLAPRLTAPRLGIATSTPLARATVLPPRRALSRRSMADDISDKLAEANLLLSDLVDDDDRESDDFKEDLASLQSAHEAVMAAYESALASGTEDEQERLKKNFGLAVVGLRDKVLALESEAL